MTEAIYLKVTEMTEVTHKSGHRAFVSGILKHLSVSHFGYHTWLKHIPSNTEKRHEAVKVKIKNIYNESKPKILTSVAN